MAQTDSGRRLQRHRQRLDHLERVVSQLQDEMGVGQAVQTSGGASIPIKTLQSGDSKDLPFPSQEDFAVALMVSSSGTAAINDPNGNNIYWPGRTPAASHDLYPRLSLFFSSDGSSWHVEDPPRSEVADFVPGKPLADELLLSWAARARYLVRTLYVEVGTDPASNYDFQVTVGNNTTTAHTLSAGSLSATFTIDEVIEAKQLLEVSAPSSADTDLEDVRLSFKLHPY